MQINNDDDNTLHLRCNKEKESKSNNQDTHQDTNQNLSFNSNLQSNPISNTTQYLNQIGNTTYKGNNNHSENHNRDQQTNEESPRKRTRGSQIRLSASLRHLTKSQLQNQLQQTQINSTVRITIAEAPMWNEKKVVGVIKAASTQHRLLQIGTEVIKLPFDEADNRVITKIEIIQDSIFNMHHKMSNGPINTQITTIFCHGVARPNPGPAAAATLLRRPDSSDVNKIEEVENSTFYARASTQQADFVAFIAACRLVARNSMPHNIVTDSELVYKTVLRMTKIRTKELQELSEMATQSFLEISGYITLIAVQKDQGNPADRITKTTLAKARGNGEENLFPHITNVPPLPKILTPAINHYGQIEVSTFEVPKTVQQFAKLRNFHTRSRVPATMIPLWTAIVRHYLQIFLTCRSEEKETAALRFILLPTKFLPTKCATTKIHRHLMTGTPFATDLEHTDTHMRTETEPRGQNHRRQQRVSEAVYRLVADHKIRTANKLLMSMSDGQELTFEQKVATFSKKIVSTHSEVDTPKFAPEQIPLISPIEVTMAINSLNRQAANAIDGWTKELLQQAISQDEEISCMIAEFLYWMISTKHTSTFNDIILLSRGVAIPKNEQQHTANSLSSRPICVSSVFLKLLGSIAMKRDAATVSPHQFAIGTSNGHVRIVHKVKHDIKSNPTCVAIRFDMKNAFGEMPRHQIYEALKTRDCTLQQYYNLVYGNNSYIAIYGKNTEPHLHEMTDGVKQGDATSSFLFCAALDIALNNTQRTFDIMGISAKIYAYMDDITITTETAQADKAVKATICSLTNIGMKVNEDKSKILSKMEGNYTLPTVHHHDDEPFVVLGSNLNQSQTSRTKFEDLAIQKQERFFDILEKANLHPQIEFTLLRICGCPRIQYLCETTEPEDTARIANFFDSKIGQRISWLIDPDGQTQLNTEQLYTTTGLGLPNYTFNRHKLFTVFQKFALQNEIQTPRVSLYNDTTISTTRRDSQIDAQWLFFEARNHLTPAQFTTALAIRIGTLPSFLHITGNKCNCGYVYSDPDSTTSHILRCDMATPITHTIRHNRVRDGIATTLRSYGLTTTTEPRCFTYDSGKSQRPDIMVHTQPCATVTDVSLVDEEVNLKTIEDEKIKIHQKTINKQNGLFIPLVMHTRGTIGLKGEQFIRMTCKAVLPVFQKALHRELHHCIAIEAAKGRADAVMAASQKAKWTI